MSTLSSRALSAPGRAPLGGRWRVSDASELYGIEQWGAGYFSVSERGTVLVHPGGPHEAAIDLKELADDLQRRGLQLPILVRFSDILRQRVDAIHQAFAAAIEEFGYDGSYRAVMPIKVNQQRHVVEELVEHGRRWGLGLEAGSKPELLIALALNDAPEGLIVCNGYKDAHYVRTALLAQRLGRLPIIVIDRMAELDVVLQESRRLGIRPHLGVRVKLAARGAGRWNESTGERSKFGLSVGELIATVERLRRDELLDCLELLHFHMGSQITAIRAVKDAMREVSRVYVDLCRLGAPLRYLDVGGGLAVDYDGSNSNFHSSMNYSLQEYANDVVYAMAEACREAKLAMPTLLSESGRALVAHHSVLLFDVLDVHRFEPRQDLAPPPDNAPKLLQEGWEILQGLTRKNYVETFHDIQALRDEAHTLFNHGLLTLEHRAQCEELVAAALSRILHIVETLDYVPEDLQPLPDALSDIYYCNFSLFQSLPDHWAVKHLFPILPIHRLDERPTRRAVLVDLTCDSDGKIEEFIDLRDVKHALPLHEPRPGEPYVIGAFLVGAYQETLGDLHNLFGDTNAVHVQVLPEGGYRLRHVVEGDAVADVLGYVQYPRRDMILRVRRATEEAVEAGRITLEEARMLIHAYETGLGGYTYLVQD